MSDDDLPLARHPGLGGRKLVRVRARNGAEHIRIEPPLETPRMSYSWIDERVQKIAGMNGITTKAEIPLARDDTGGECERCGSDGVENHHTAPRAIFGEEEAESYPQCDLCVDCHVQWHQTMREYWEEVARQAATFVDLHRRTDMRWRDHFEFWADTKDLPDADRARVKHVVKGMLS